MAQEVLAEFAGVKDRLALPDPEEYIFDGVRWGWHYVLFTPAFWATLAWLDREDKRYHSYRIGETLKEEIAACLLGGYGIPAEVGLAAFSKVRQARLLDGSPPSEQELYQVLSEPLKVGKRLVHYRFAHQRSRYLSAALHRAHHSSPPTENHHAFRSWLLELRGVGLKTASWITRNWLDSNEVAIIDIHIYRAGVLMGLYRRDELPAKHYFKMEQRFLQFAVAIDVKPAILDTLIWRQMKDAGNIVLELIKKREN